MILERRLSFLDQDGQVRAWTREPSEELSEQSTLLDKSHLRAHISMTRIKDRKVFMDLVERLFDRQMNM